MDVNRGCSDVGTDRLSAAAGTRSCDGPVNGNPLLDRLDPRDGRRLLTLPGELVWATTWMTEANEIVSPRLGLPLPPVIDWPDPDEEPDGGAHRKGVHWKTVSLTAHPFVWLDDETTDADQRWVAVHHPRPALLQRVDPLVGLTNAAFAAVRQWLVQHDEIA
ncbi:hypothetical protein [Phytohabitans kaempferiae]|uniref:Uncharacterized protein n=1 Tax=Phytohabitans kaempferiae TaxID=1620943 RepID=A0ABV6M3S5_9ACTN